MGREVRRVPIDWEHPTDDRDNYIPLHDGSFEQAARDWKEEFSQWEAGFRTSWRDDNPWTPRDGSELTMEFWEWNGNPPDRESYRPDWPEESRTCYQVYENVSEGTPISPVLETRDELINWLVNNGDGMGIGGTAYRMNREQAERFANAGFAVSLVSDGSGIRSGVESV